MEQAKSNQELINFNPINKAFERAQLYQKIGKISSSKGNVYEVSLPRAQIGGKVEFITDAGTSCFGEIIALRGKMCLAMSYEEIPGIDSETRVYMRDLSSEISLFDSMLGRILDYQGIPIDKKGNLTGPFENRSVFGHPSNPLERPTINQPVETGIHSIDFFTTAGTGQRLAIMSGSGVGKSVLLGMIARYTRADVSVIALVGERGREVLEFIERDLGEEGLKRSVVVVATSDLSPLIRMRAAYTATTIAEFFRDKNKNVMLMMDSITRFAMASREIALAAGEPPGPKGYTPSVFSRLPKLLERAGTKLNSGSITGMYTVLVEGGDMDEPIADAIRAISDGHIILSRQLAQSNHFPAVDILASISRVMGSVVTKEHKILASKIRNLLAAYHDSIDLINVGAYVKGSSPNVDMAIFLYEKFMLLMKQDVDFYQSYTIDELYKKLEDLLHQAESAVLGKTEK
jgi:flagellum-specific ATP synthase